jgi:hypothetical protein
LAAETGFFASNGEARRELKQQSISVNKSKVGEDYSTFSRRFNSLEICSFTEG